MEVLPKIAALGLCAGVMCAGLWLLWRTRSRTPGRQPVRARPFMTENELEFLGRLRRAMPALEFSPQVSMGALLDPDLPHGHRHTWTVRRTFSMKIIDFVAYDALSRTVVAVVELDDKTHDVKHEKDSRRDDLLASAGIRTLRWDSRAKPSDAEIVERFRALRLARR